MIRTSFGSGSGNGGVSGDVVARVNSLDTPGTILATESGTTFTNTGSTEKNYQNLPAATVGLSFGFYVSDDDGFRINAQDGEYIRIMDTISDAGGSLDSNDVGSYVYLRCMIAGEWSATEVTGLWTVSGGVVSDDLTEIMEGLVAFWDGKSYTSGQTLHNSIEEPADNADQTDYDVYLGATNSVSSDDPAFLNNHFTFDGSDFLSSITGNTSFIEEMHKTVTGTSWTLWAKIRTGTDAATLDSFFGTASVAGDVGVIMRGDSTGTIKLDHYDGTTFTTKSASAKVSANKLYDIFISYSFDNNRVKFAIAEHQAATIESQSLTADFEPAITAAATYDFNIGAEGNAASKMEANTQLYGMVLIDHELNDEEISNMFQWSSNYFDPIIVELPTAPYRIISMPSDEAAHFAWVLQSNGGSTISDYKIEYKLTSEPTVWTDFVHTPSGRPECTVTGLTNGSSYDFRFAAINSEGQGAYSSTITLTPVATGTEPYDLSPLNKITLPVNASGLRLGSSVEVLPTAIDTYESAYFGRRDGVFVFKCPDGGATTSSNASYCRSELRHLTNIDEDDASSDVLDFAVLSIPDGQKVVCHQIHGFGDDDSPWTKGTYLGKDNGTGTWRHLIQPSPTSNDPEHPLVTVTLKTGITNGTRIKDEIRVVQEGARTFLEIYIDDGVNGMVPATVISQSTGVTAQQPSLVGQPCRVEMFRTTPYYYKRGNYYQVDQKLGNVCVVEHYTCAGQYGE